MTLPWNFASLWEGLADALGDQLAVAHGPERLDWATYEDRAARLAGVLVEHGVGPGTAVGLYLYNGNEYLVAHFAALKLGAVPVNVNYRYLDEELAYLLDNAEAEVLVFHRSLAERVARVAPGLPRLGLLIEVDDGGEHLDGAHELAELVAAHPPLPRRERAEDDVYMLYTGGTTGMPKGVMYHQGRFSRFWAVRQHRLLDQPSPERPEDCIALGLRLAEEGGLPASVAASPLMHGTGMWLGGFVPQSVGGSVHTLASRHFDPDELWATVAGQRCSALAIVGDPFARPLLEALDRAADAGTPYDVSSVRLLYSSGAMFSAEMKEGLLRHLDARLIDAFGSTESSLGAQTVDRAADALTARFTPNPGVKVFAEDGHEVEAGSDEAGLLHAPALMIGYFKDPEKTARTLRVVDGEHYVVPGDWAKVAADGTIVFLGRGSGCINTGGEKVFPEEVEEAVKAHPDIADCLVVGVPDQRYGEVVAAVAAPEAGRRPEAALVQAWLHGHLANFKVPKRLVLADQVRRLPNGKPDYAWARQVLDGGETPLT